MEKQKDIQISNMTLNDFFNDVIVEQIRDQYKNDPALKTTKTKPLVDAIVNRHPITFYYSGPRKPKSKSVKAGYRVKAEAVALGLNKKGVLVVRAYIDDPSKSKRGTPNKVGLEKSNYGWRTFYVLRMTNIQVEKNEVFNTIRTKFNGGGKEDDKSMSVTYVTADFNTEPKKPVSKKVTKPTAKPVAKPTVKPTVKPAPQVTQKTRNFDQEISKVQDELSKLADEIKASGDSFIAATTPEEKAKIKKINNDLVARRNELEKKEAELIDQMAKQSIDVENKKAQKFMSNYRARKDAEKNNKPLQSKPTVKPEEPTVEKPQKNNTLPEIPKKQKPSDTPDDNAINESVLGRIKNLMNKMNYL
jgi:hypothetical protein